MFYSLANILKGAFCLADPKTKSSLKVNNNGSLDANIKNLKLASDGSLDVNLQDQVTPPIDTYFLQSLSNFNLAVDTVASGIEVGDLVYTFTATAGHGIAPADEILLLDVAGDRSFYAEVLGVVGNVITVDRPIDHIFPSANALGRIVNSNMNVDGSGTPVIFSLRAGSTPIDFVRFLLTMTDDANMDDSTFGSRVRLTRGMVLRIVNGFQETIFNWKTNGEIAQWCYDTKYPDKKPAGEYGFNARTTFGGPSKHGVVLRIGTGDVIQIIVQDNLTSQTSIKWSAEGHKINI
jgi:hypothetical protein